MSVWQEIMIAMTLVAVGVIIVTKLSSATVDPSNFDTWANARKLFNVCYLKISCVNDHYALKF